MRLVTFESELGRRAGALVEGGARVVDFAEAHQQLFSERCPEVLTSILAMADGGQNALDHAYELIKATNRLGDRALLRMEAVKLCAPIPEPPQMRDFLCFEEHLIQGNHQARLVRASQFANPEEEMARMEREGILRVPDVWYERPLFYHPNRFTVCGPDSVVHWPAYSQKIDFELEFGFFVGKSGKDISRESAREHIFGYTIFNDFSARDEQVKDMPGQLGPGKGKNFDDSNALGPCLVTADEIPDPYNLEMVVRINGEEWGRGNTRDMYWKFEDLIAHVSRSETLHTGEFFGSGTVGGGSGMEQGRFLNSGDVVELEVERIGVLRNQVIAS